MCDACPCNVILLDIQPQENRHVNYHLGFRQECERRLGAAGEVLQPLAVWA